MQDVQNSGEIISSLVWQHNKRVSGLSSHLPGPTVLSASSVQLDAFVIPNRSCIHTGPKPRKVTVYANACRLSTVIARRWKVKKQAVACGIIARIMVYIFNVVISRKF